MSILEVTKEEVAALLSHIDSNGSPAMPPGLKRAIETEGGRLSKDEAPSAIIWSQKAKNQIASNLGLAKFIKELDTRCSYIAHNNSPLEDSERFVQIELVE